MMPRSMALAATSRPMLLSSAAGCLVGVLYGLMARLLFGNQDVRWLKTAFAAVSVAFLFLVPTALGALVVWLASLPGPRKVVYWIFAPWVPCLLLMIGIGALAWEGLIC